jgi:hypothetical protein
LKESGVTVKVCSGLGLDIDLERRKLLESLGLEASDYIHAPDKAEAMVHYIAEAHSTAPKPAKEVKDSAEAASVPTKETEPVHYFALLVDNYLPDGPDLFYRRFEQAVRGIQISHNVRITPLFVQDNRFMREVRAQLPQLRREMGYALQLYRPLLTRQKEEAERRLAALAQSEDQLVELIAASA